jgi:hypothetical protein
LPAEEAWTRAGGVKSTGQSFTVDGASALVNGFQSTVGLSIAACGISCATMRSSARWITRWRSSPSRPLA